MFICITYLNSHVLFYICWWFSFCPRTTQRTSKRVYHFSRFFFFVFFPKFEKNTRRQLSVRLTQFRFTKTEKRRRILQRVFRVRGAGSSRPGSLCRFVSSPVRSVCTCLPGGFVHVKRLQKSIGRNLAPETFKKPPVV